ncbi:MAG TPA: flagellin [Bryobacteraceae bacterium]|nr:flagellin [Bryobacteraceae bacterium]
MLSGIDPTSQQTLDSINLIQQRLNSLQAQISSGIRINRASDDPSVLADVFQTRSDLAHVQQVQKNLSAVQTEAQTADTTLQQAVQLVQSASVLASQGANSLTAASDRTQLSAQVSGILSQLVSDANAEVNGQFIFSGDQPTSAPYQLDPTNLVTGTQQLVTAPSTRLIQDANGVTFAPALTAQQIFDVRDSSNNPTTGNVFAAIQGLINALNADDPTQVSNSITALNQAGTYLNQQLAFYGDVQNRITTAQSIAQTYQTNDTQTLSKLQDADVASDAIQLTQLNTQLNASLGAASKMRTSSLFDYLK